MARPNYGGAAASLGLDGVRPPTPPPLSDADADAKGDGDGGGGGGGGGGGVGTLAMEELSKPRDLGHQGGIECIVQSSDGKVGATQIRRHPAIHSASHLPPPTNPPHPHQSTHPAAPPNRYPYLHPPTLTPSR